jgi:putative flippase GtrA
MNASQLMQAIAQRRGVRQFVKFGIVGASGFIVNLLIFTLVFRLTPVPEHTRIYMLTYSVAFLAGGVSNYVLNRTWTFRATGHALVQGLQFLTVSAMALAVGLIVSKLLLMTGRMHAGHIVWFIATLSGMLVNFFVNKYWTFRPSA